MMVFGAVSRDYQVATTKDDNRGKEGSNLSYRIDCPSKDAVRIHFLELSIVQIVDTTEVSAHLFESVQANLK